MKRWILLDGLFLLALMMYVVAGYQKVPLHGDEPTHIYMSRDYYYLVQERDLDAVYYTASPENPAEQELRILNGTVHKMLMGLAWDLAGLTVNDVNEQWVWEWTWDQNVTLGHMPGDELLYAARLSSVLLAALSVLLVFGITHLVTDSRLAAWAASVIYATNPAVLLNGRRAMMEGALLFFTVLVVLVAVIIIREQLQRGRTRIGWYVALGVAGGFAVASKHNAGVIVVAAFAGVFLMMASVLQYAPTEKRQFISVIGKLSFAGILVLVTFLALTPAWWSDPFGVPERVLSARSRLLEGQSEQARQNGDDFYNHAGDRVAGLINEAFFAGPQYYEVPVWRDYIGGQIESYEQSGLAGRGGGLVWGLLLVALVMIGALRRGVLHSTETTKSSPNLTLAILIILSVTALSLLIVTPFEWQRYYLLLHLPLAVIAGSGVAQISKRWGHVA